MLQKIDKAFKVFHLSNFIQAASGERFAPLGSWKQVEESNAMPVP